MMMNEPMTWIFALVAGVLIGLFFFGGLWWTIQKGLNAKNPALWFLGSVLIRTGVAVAGFYWMAGGEWERLLACLLGFVAARFIILRLKHTEKQSVVETKNDEL
jgi:F1F0 ATPase subunit 2